MQGKVVSFEPLSRIHPFVNPCRVMYLHTHIDAKQEESEVESDSNTPVCRDAFREIVPSEDCRIILRGILMLECPYITCVKEHGSVQFPYDVETILYVCLEQQIVL